MRAASDRYDVVVVGGGAAGLSGALTLARSRRSVLVVDAGEPRNAPAEGVHNYLTRDGTPPAELLAAGRAEVAGYGGQVVRGEVVAAERVVDGFRVSLADGQVLGARRLLVTTGLVDEVPDLPGLRAQWGRGVVSCPYCHGWEVRDKAIGVLSTGRMALHQAELFRQWSADVTLLVHRGPEPTPEEAERLAARDVAVVRGPVESLDVVDGDLRGVRLAGGRVVPVQVVVAAPRAVARSAVLDGLGIELSPHPLGVEAGEYVAGDPTGRAAPGVWVAGNVADVSAWVMAAASAGVRAAAAVNIDLIEEEVQAAVAARRAAPSAGTPSPGQSPGDEPATGQSPAPPFSAALEAEACEATLGDRRHGL